LYAVNNSVSNVDLRHVSSIQELRANVAYDLYQQSLNTDINSSLETWRVVSLVVLSVFVSSVVAWYVSSNNRLETVHRLNAETDVSLQALVGQVQRLNMQTGLLTQRINDTLPALQHTQVDLQTIHQEIVNTLTAHQHEIDAL
jgi:hypothetical protein